MSIRKNFKDLVSKIEEVGKKARAYFDAEDNIDSLKADGSVVTRIDDETEKELVEYINQNFPDDAIVAEEGASKDGSSGFVWHIDPIDGTDNFFRRIPFCAVSVARLGDKVNAEGREGALGHKAEDSFGIVHNPITGQTFSSLMENGVYENQKVHMLNNEVIGGRIIIGVGHGRESWMKPTMYNMAKEAVKQFGKFQSFGCQALELAYVSANRIDGALSFGLHSYDYAAGLYLVKAGGGKISVFENGEWTEWTDSLKELCAEHGKTIFASHKGIHDQALSLIGNPRDWAD